MNKIKFSHVKITINRNKINKIINILKLENKSSVLARLNSKNITTYINRVVASDQLKLYLAFYKKKIIGYAVVAEKPEYLTSNFKYLFYCIFYFCPNPKGWVFYFCFWLFLLLLNKAKEF